VSFDLEPLHTSISVQAETLSRLAQRGDQIREELSMLYSKVGLLTQEYFILNEAMRETLNHLNRGS